MKSPNPVAWHIITNKDELAAAIWSNVSRLMRGRIARYEQLRRLALDDPFQRGDNVGIGSRARHNVVLNAIESVQAEHARDLPRPMLVPIGADWKTRRKVQVLQRVIDGEWKILGAEAKRERQVLDAAMYGTGVIRVQWWGGRTRMDRVHPAYLLSEPHEEASGAGTLTRYQVTLVNKWALSAEYEDAAKAIDSGTPPSRELFATADSEGHVLDDYRVMIEAWRLCDTAAGHGRYVVCIPNAVLLDDEKWHGRTFPHSVLPYSTDPEDSTHGRGLAQRMAGQQDEQNSTSEIMSDNTRLVAGVRYVLYNGARITSGNLTDESGDHIAVDGPPGSLQVLSVSGNAIDLVMQARLDRQEMLADQGISPLSTSGQIPDQVDSGKAQQVYHDKVAGRLAVFGRQVERATVDLALLHIDALEEAVKDHADGVEVYCSRLKGIGADLKRYADVRVARDHVHAEVFPVSKLSRDVPGRMADVTEMAKAQVLTPAEARRLMAIPDIEEANDLASAAKDLALDMIDRALDIDAEAARKGKAVPVSRAADRAFLLEQGWAYYAKHLLEGATEDDLYGLSLLLGTADGQLQQEAEAAAAAAMAMAPAPAPPPTAAAPPAEPAGQPMLPAAQPPQAAGIPGA